MESNCCVRPTNWMKTIRYPARFWPMPWSNRPTPRWKTIGGKPSDISRAHEIHNPEPGWWDVAGGKLTTYRLMGEQTVNQIVEWLQGLHKLHGEVGRCRTAQEPLLPTDRKSTRLNSSHLG